MKLLVAFNLCYIAITLMFAAKPERLAAASIHFPLAGRGLHYLAYCLLIIGLYLVKLHHGWEIGVPIWLAMVMIAGAMVVAMTTVIPKSIKAITAINLASLVIGIYLILS
ncbi:MAG: hypothetical protein COA83_02640 [Methylophaga sp.]|nr:MAG: hypothetical protein COA83_02640 [Methylophaga sp.]